MYLSIQLNYQARPGAGAGGPAPLPSLRSRLEGAGRRGRRGQLRVSACAPPRCAAPSRSASARSTACCTRTSTATSHPRRSSSPESRRRPSWRRAWGSTAPTSSPATPTAAGRNEGEATWPLAGGGHLHNTGSWVFASAFHNPGTPPSPYWPGTVTWVEDTGPPRRKQLLLDRSHADMTELIRRVRQVRG